jgi:hypothetical protein
MTKDEIKVVKRKFSEIVEFIFNYFESGWDSSGDQKELGFVIELLDLVETMISVGFFSLKEEFQKLFMICCKLIEVTNSLTRLSSISKDETRKNGEQKAVQITEGVLKIKLKSLEIL